MKYALQDVPYIWIEENPKTGHLDQFAQYSPSVENVVEPLPPRVKDPLLDAGRIC